MTRLLSLGLIVFLSLSSLPTVKAETATGNVMESYLILDSKRIGYNYKEMKECLDYTRASGDPLTLFHSNHGLVTLNCGSLRHITKEGHFTDSSSNRDWSNFQECLAKVLLAEDFNKASIPNWGRKRFNTYSRV